MKYSQGKIKLENKVIDLTTFEIRPKITNEDLERNYDSFLDHVYEIKDDFYDFDAFFKTVDEVTKNKRPKLISREPKYPFMWIFRSSFVPFDFLRPKTRRLNDDYFMIPQCIMAISSKNKIQEEKPIKPEEPLDQKLRDDIKEKFEKYPGYECIIEIPNDMAPFEVKHFTYHESLHYFVRKYQIESKRNFVDIFKQKNLSDLEKYQFENVINEHTVEILTDKLLNHDPDSQFECRYLHYNLENNFEFFTLAASGIAVGLTFVSSFSNPYLFPLVFVPGRIRDYVNLKQKQSKKDELLKPREYPHFKI